MTAKTFTRSFAGGEISPLLYGRLDLAKNQTGLAKCLNFLVTPQGPIENRAGFEYVLQAKGACALIPFVYNAQQSFALEFGNTYIRFHTQGGTLLEASKAITAITQANPAVFASAGHGYSVNNWVRLDTVGGMTALSSRWFIVSTVPDANHFTLIDLYGTVIDSSALPAYTGGGTAARVYEIASPYAVADVFDLHYVQSADVLTIVHQAYATRELRRLGGTNWTLTAPTFAPTIATPGAPTVSTGGPGGGTPQDHTYAVTAVAGSSLEESLASASATASRDLSVAGNFNEVQPPVVVGAIRYNVYKFRSGIFGYIGQTDGSPFRDENIEPDMSKTPPLGDNPFAVGTISAVAVTNGGTGYGTVPTGGAINTVTVTNGGAGYTDAAATASGGGSGATFTVNFDGSGVVTSVTITNGGSLYVAPTITITSASGTGATATATATPLDNSVVLGITDATGSGATLEGLISGGVFTSVRVRNPGANYTAPTITVPIAHGGSGATFAATVTGSSVYPQAVSYYEQRRVFGGSAGSPQTVWATRAGTESNMSYSIPTQDDDAITARIVAREAQTVRHLVPMGELLALTSGGVWKISSSDGGAITPATFSVRPQSYVGASNAQPVTTSDSALYVQARGSHLREISYSWEAQKYTSADLSLLAPHLFDFKTVVQLAFSATPYQVLWAVRSDGVLLANTYQPEHEVKAWHQHTTNGGFFESVCSIPEGQEDGVYVAVRRTTPGGTLHYIERMHSRQFATLADAFFVDSGATYSGSPATVISGLWHLEGQTVAILADGGVQPQQTVANGTVTLPAAASTVHIGQPYICDAQTMPLATEALAAFGQGVPKNVNKVWLSVLQSSSIKAGPSFDRLRSYVQRTVEEAYGSPPALKTGMAEITLDPQWQQEGSLCIRQSDPLPLTLRAMTLEVATGG